MSINEFVEMTIFLCLICFSIYDKMQGFIGESGLFIYFLCFTQKFKMAAKSGGKTFFCEIMPVDSVDTLWVKNFVEIALSRSVSEINMLLHFTQKFKMAAKSGGKTIFEKSRQ